MFSNFILYKEQINGKLTRLVLIICVGVCVCISIYRERKREIP